MSGEIRVKYAAGKAGRRVAARIQPGTDLLLGIEQICRETGIVSASVECFGSLERAGFFVLVPKPSAKMRAGYGDIIRVAGPVEFLGGLGIVCLKDGIYDIHFHATLCDATGKVFGGHMVKGENPALTTVDMIISEITGVEMLRAYEEETDLTQFLPKIK